MSGKKTKAIISLCGKGGVGKTTVSALIVKALIEDPSKRVLAIDADPAVGLATALKINVKTTVDDIRNQFIELLEKGGAGDRDQVLGLLDYEMTGALHEKDNLAFLSIGRSETDGCYCQVNDLLKDIIGAIAENFDYLVIDAEAGVEQVNRRVLEKVTHLILISDLSTKGIKAAETIFSVAVKAVGFDKAGLIINRVRDQEEMKRITLPSNIAFLGSIPEDSVIRNADIEENNFLTIESTPAYEAVKRAMRALGVAGFNTTTLPGEGS
ncbi:MAG: cobyrinic acid a,c-diamide synthase [Firmicutes bacterium]|nr:cobyrinic acid a,c-diamide synthase [Bacillota bacterium]